VSGLHAAKTEAQFPFWTATDSLCRRYSVDLASPGSDMILHPTSFSSAKDLGPIAPIVSIVIRLLIDSPTCYYNFTLYCMYITG